LEHGFPVFRELRKVDVRVGVDEVHEADQNCRRCEGMIYGALLQTGADLYVFGKAG
jgi:hypothetical protein